MEKVINLVIQQMEMLIQRVNKLEYITEAYHEYKNEKQKFIEFLNKKIEEDDKNGTVDSLHNDKQQSVPTSGGSSGESDGGGGRKSNQKKKEGKDNESI